MLLEQSKQNQKTQIVSLSEPLDAARGWISDLYACLLDKQRLESVVVALGKLLKGEICLVRITCMDTRGVFEWQPPNGDYHGYDDALLEGSRDPVQMTRDHRCLSIWAVSNVDAGMLITLASPECEIILLLSQVRSAEDVQEFALSYCDCLYLVLPQLIQVQRLLGKLHKPIQQAELARNLLHVVPLPLVAINAQSRLVMANRSVRCIVTRKLGSDSMIGQSLCYDSLYRQLRCGSVRLSAASLFEDQWGDQRVTILAVEDCREQPRLNIKLLQSIYQLSSAEIAICESVLRGCEPTQIAELQSRSINTIKSQLRSVYRKTGVSNTAQLACRLFFNPAYWVGRQDSSVN